MRIDQFGRVLLAMSKYAGERADLRRDYLGQRNSELLWAISHTLKTGAVACLQIAEGHNDDLPTVGEPGEDNVIR